jgi:large subunit ribosomal protein L4e
LKTSYGRGMSRVPRKLMMSRGGQFHWVGATSPNTRGGRRAHPPRVESMTVFLKINKKEMRLALMSALSATINSEKICLKYSKVEKDLIKNIPAIIEKIDGIKAKNLSELIISVLGNSLYEIVLKKKSVRAGRGKMRGRKYKANAGILIVIGEKEKLKTKMFEVQKVKTLSVNLLQRAGKEESLFTQKMLLKN